MTQTAPAKFTFDLDMSIIREKTSVIAEKTLAQMLEKARSEGFEEGRVAGETGATAQAQQAIQAAAEQLVHQALHLLGAMDETHKYAMSQAAVLGATIGKKLATHLVERMPTVELDALIADCMSSLKEAPHLVIRCHPDLTEIITKTAEKHMATSGFSGRMLVMGEPEIALGDGRLEWADGGLVRDIKSISDEIETTISAYLAANGAPPIAPELSEDEPADMQDAPAPEEIE